MLHTTKVMIRMMIKVEDHHYTKHLSQFLFPFWSHELLLLWLLEFIAELLKPKMSFAQICLNVSFNFNTFAFEEPASAFPFSGSPPAPPSSRSSLKKIGCSPRYQRILILYWGSTCSKGWLEPLISEAEGNSDPQLSRRVLVKVWK